MEPDRIDLSALDPAADPAAWERRIAELVARAAPELARRATARSPLLLLAARSGRPAGPGPGFTDALEVPPPVNAWLVANREPTIADLIVAMEEPLP